MRKWIMGICPHDPLIQCPHVYSIVYEKGFCICLGHDAHDSRTYRLQVFKTCRRTIHQKLRFCHEDGDWRVHDIIRYNSDPDDKESTFSFMETMQSYLAESQE